MNGQRPAAEGSLRGPRLATTSDMPDVASRAVQHAEGTLDWVGMGEIRQPIEIRDGDATRAADARVQVYVNLEDAKAKGIHMSRLYLILDEHATTRALTSAGLKLLLKSLLESHRDLSTHAFVEFSFDYYLRRRSLVTEHSGWNSYPVAIRGMAVDGKVTYRTRSRRLVFEHLSRLRGTGTATHTGTLRR